MQTKYKLESIKSSYFDFGGGELSSESGLLLLHEYLNKSGILELFAQKYPENREGIYQHQKPNMLYQQIQRIISGYTNNNVASFLQKDPVYKQIHNKNGLASSSTICRWGKSWDETDCHKLQNIHDELIEAYYTQTKPEKIVVDIDTTYDPASENLEGVSFNNHYQETGYSPMVAFDSENGLPLRGKLRPGNEYCNQGAELFLRQIFSLLPELCFVSNGVFCRADSGFACPEVYKACEENNVFFTIKLKHNAVLYDYVDKYCFDHKIKPCPEETQIYYFGTTYQSKSWDKARRVVFKMIFPAGALFPTYQAIVTNDLTMTAEDIFTFYNQRAVCENHIEEGKNGYSWDHLSLKSFVANKTRFLIFILAMMIFRLFQLETMNKNWAKKSIQTIRCQLFRVASKLVSGARKSYFRLSGSFVFQEIFTNIYHNIQALNWSFVAFDP